MILSSNTEKLWCRDWVYENLNSAVQSKNIKHSTSQSSDAPYTHTHKHTFHRSLFIYCSTGVSLIWEQMSENEECVTRSRVGAKRGGNEDVNMEFTSPAALHVRVLDGNLVKSA